MAKEEKKENSGKVKTPLHIKLIYFSLMVVAAVFTPLTIIFFVCMIPSLVAALVDRNPQRTAWATVGAANFAGTVPAWIQLWDKGLEITRAIEIISDPTTLLIAYSGAGAGWLIYNNIPPLIASGMIGKSKRRYKDIETRQKELIRRWGEGVTK